MLVRFSLYAAICSVLVSYIVSAPLSIFAVAKASNARNIEAVHQFMQLKAGPIGRQAYWHYNGVVRNPLTGMEVAGIEGIEVVRPLDTVHTTQKLTNGSWIGEGFAGSYLSKKVFVYVDKANRTSQIEKYRIRHHAPQRTVNPVKQYAELVTVGVEPSGSIFASIRWPTGRTLHTNKVRFTQSDDGIAPLDQLLGKRKVNVINFMSAAVRKTGLAKRPLSKWISFSPSSDDGTTGRSQEYYSISNTGSLQNNENAPITATPLEGNKRKLTLASTTAAAPDSAQGASFHNVRDSIVSKSTWTHKLLQPFRPRPSAVVSYRRYGEGPPWFAVGKACVIEMNGARYDTAQALPASVRELVGRLQPDFFSSGARRSRSDSASHSDSTCYSASPLANGAVAVHIKAPAESTENRARTSTSTSSSKAIVPMVRFSVLTDSKEKGLHSARGGLLTRQWFDAQADLADNYKPWYSMLLPVLPRK